MARQKGVNWVMLDTDDVSTTRYVQKYGVYMLPHFEFISASGLRDDVPEEGGPVDISRIAARVAMLTETDRQGDDQPPGLVFPQGR